MVAGSENRPPAESESIPASTLPSPLGEMAALRSVGPPNRPGLIGSIDRFELCRLLGRGGMGIVFLARDTADGNKVALKLIRPDLGIRPEAVQRFLNEVHHMQKLKHAHIVPVLDVRERGEESYFVMPFYDQGSLANRLHSAGRFGSQEILAVAIPIAEALQFAHRKGIIHRDLKLANILLCDNGAAVLSDFGLARTVFNDALLDPNQEQCEGTAPYMSPQVARGDAEDTRCDIYSFGAVLYELTAGFPPYRGRSVQAIREQILAGPPKRLREVNSKADPSLDQVAETAMAREHRDRYANMSDVLADLERISCGKRPLGPHRVRSLPVQVQSRRSVVAIASTVLAVSLATFWLLRANPRLQIMEFAAPGVDSWLGAMPAHWRSVGAKDLLVTHNRDLLAFSASGRLIDRSWHCPNTNGDSISLSLVADAEGDGEDEAFVSWSSGRSCYLQEINPNGFSLRRFAALGGNPHAMARAPSRVSTLSAVCLLEKGETSDARKKLVGCLTTGFGGSPRALLGFDYQTARMDWQLQVGPILQSFEKVSFGPGREAVICGSLAVCNGNAANGSDDGHSYVFAVSDSGDLLWRHEMGGAFTVASVVVMHGQGPSGDKLFAWVQPSPADHGHHQPGLSRVIALDHEGKVLATYETGCCLESCLAADLEGNGKTSLLCADCEGYVEVLDPASLRAIRKVRILDPTLRPGSLDRAEIRLLECGSFRSDKSRQILVQDRTIRQAAFRNPGILDRKADPIEFENVEVRLLDAHLGTWDRYVFAKQMADGMGWAVKTAKLGGSDSDEVLLLSDRVQILNWRKL